MAGPSSYNDDRQRVLDATDLVALIGEHLSLKRKGREYVCLCPFHNDHSPSMYVVPHKQIYHCFVCGAGGNAIDFMINYHKMDFPEVLNLLAERAGVTLTPWKPSRAGGPVADPSLPVVDKADLVRANETAASFFRTILQHAEHGTRAREVIQQRGISPEMVERFQLGAAPDRWDGLLLTAQQRDIPTEHLQAAGLVQLRREVGGHYDVFRNRLMFPIRDQLGRVIAFGGRRLNPEDEPKYRNSQETAVFDKSSTLFGLQQARQAVVDDGRIVVTEGYTDVIACHQAGFENVVATLGTALTARHARILKRLCDTVILLFDGDEAGQRAADRALEVFFAEPIDVKIAILPQGTDPDDLLKQADGPERFRALLSGAVDSLAYHADRLREKVATVRSMSARATLVGEELERLMELGLNRVEPLRKSLIVRSLSSILRVDEAAVLAQVRQLEKRALGRRRSDSEQEMGVSAHESAQELRQIAEDEILGCILVDPTLFRGKSLDPGLFADGLRRELAVRLAGVEPDEIEHIMTEVDDARVRLLAVRCYARVKRITSESPARLQATYDQCLRTLEGLRSPTGEKPRPEDPVVERLRRIRTASPDPAALARTTDT
jgi:DNA primase